MAKLYVWSGNATFVVDHWAPPMVAAARAVARWTKTGIGTGPRVLVSDVGFFTEPIWEERTDDTKRMLADVENRLGRDFDAMFHSGASPRRRLVPDMTNIRATPGLAPDDFEAGAQPLGLASSASAVKSATEESKIDLRLSQMTASSSPMPQSRSLISGRSSRDFSFRFPMCRSFLWRLGNWIASLGCPAAGLSCSPNVTIHSAATGEVNHTAGPDRRSVASDGSDTSS